jgi:phosphoglucosamine mutase
MGVDVHSVGVVPTPALAFLAGEGGFAAGIMVSASHNPAEDNGLKVLDPSGQKLADDAEEDSRRSCCARTSCRACRRPDRRAVDASALLERYVAHRTRLARRSRRAACTSSSTPPTGPPTAWGPQIVRATGAHGHGDPRPARRRQHQPRLRARPTRRRWRRPSSSTGLTSGSRLDGDADRCVAVDGDGRLVDGDQVLGILALERLERNALDRGSLVVSVLSNGGLQHAVERAGGRIVRTPVGDKHILGRDARVGRRPGRREERARHRPRAQHLRRRASSPRSSCCG